MATVENVLIKNSKMYGLSYLPMIYYIKEGNKFPLGEKNDLNPEEIEKYNILIKEARETDSNIWAYNFSQNQRNKNEFISLKNFHKKSYSLFLKHSKNIYCIDIDDPKIKNINDLNESFNIFKSSFWTPGNTKGIHIYIMLENAPIYDNELNIIKDYKGDLIKNKRNIWEKADNLIYNNNFVKVDFNNIKNLFNLEQMNIKTKEQQEKQQEQQEKTKELKTNINKINNLENLLYEIIEKLNDKRADDFNEWLSVGMALRPYDNINIWFEFSKKNLEKFNKRGNIEYMKQQWMRFRCDNCFNVYSILKWLKEDNEEAYNIINEKYKMINKNNFWDSWISLRDYIIKNLFSEKIFSFKELGNNNENYNFLKYNDEKKIYFEADETTIKKNILEYLEKLTLELPLKDGERDDIVGKVEILLKQLSLKVYEKKILEKFDNVKYIINFRDGLIDLKTGEIRERKDDELYIIHEDYDILKDVNEDIKKEIYNDLLKIYNDDETLLNDALTFYGYAITGETNIQSALFNVGELGSNGKTTTGDIFEKVLSKYAGKLGSAPFFEQTNDNNKSKYLDAMTRKRLLFVEEFESGGNKNIDEKFFKEIIGSKKINFSELFAKKCRDYIINCKFSFIGNEAPKFSNSGAILRRGLMIKYNNKFIDNEDYEKLKEHEKKNIYIKDCNFLNKFDNDDYKRAFISLLIPFSVKYYKNNEIKFINGLKDNFKESTGETDIIKNYFDDYINYAKADDKNDYIGKTELYENFKIYQKSKGIKYLYTEDEFTKKLRQQKGTLYSSYNKDKQVKGIRGAYMGVSFLEECATCSCRFNKEEIKEHIKTCKEHNEENEPIKKNKISFDL